MASYSGEVASLHKSYQAALKKAKSRQAVLNCYWKHKAQHERLLTKLRERDQQLFERIVTATREHDTSASRVLSSELAEVRKVSRMLSNARISLEQVQLRLTTIHDLGDAMVSIGPAMSTMKGLKSSLGRFMPEADAELTSMTQTLGGLMTDSLSGDSFNSMQSDVSNEETDAILQEASTVAEQQTDEKFPSIPTTTPTGLPSQTTSNSMNFLE